MLGTYTLEGLLQRLSLSEEVELPDAALMAWTSGQSPPSMSNAPRRALDLACGLGTHARYLVRRHYQVDALSHDAHSLHQARSLNQTRNAEEETIRDLSQRHEQPPAIRFIHVDPLDFKPDRPYDLVVDYGCFHRLSRRRRQKYLAQLDLWTHAGSEFILLVPEPRLPFTLHPHSKISLQATFRHQFRLLEQTESSFWTEHASPVTRFLIGDRQAHVYRFERRG